MDTPDPALVAIVSGIIKERTPHWDAVPHVNCARCDSANDLAVHILLVIEPRIRADEDVKNTSARAELYVELDRVRRERDAARADAQRFSAEIDRMVGELSAIRMEHEAEVAALTDALDIAKDERYAARVEQARAAQRLRDLRAKVEGLEHDATCSFIPQDGPCDCVRGAVLALLDEEEVPHG